MLEVLEFEDVQFDNEFWKPSPYKGRPTPELEKRWHDLWFCELLCPPACLECTDRLSRFNHRPADELLPVPQQIQQ